MAFQRYNGWYSVPDSFLVAIVEEPRQSDMVWSESATSWFKHETLNFVSHECRMQKQLECHIFGNMVTAMNSGRGWHNQFFVKDLGLVLALKMCPDQSQAFEGVNFTVGRKKTTPYFLGEPLPGAPRHVCTKFRANIRRTNCVGPKIS